MGIRGILFEVTPLKNGVPTTINMTRWGAESNATQVDGKQWLPIITQRHQSSMAIASSGQLTAPTTSWGGLTVAMGPDFGNEEVSSYQWVGQQGRIWVGDEDQPFSTWTLKFTGTVGSIERQNNKATIQLLGPEADLTGNLLSLSYAGTGGIEGTPDMMGQLKPRAFGSCLTVAPVQIDPVYLVYQVHGYGPIISFPHVYEFAQSLDSTKNKGNAASYADLIAMTLVPGEWATCTAQGLFRLGAQPKNKISADVVASAGTVAEVGRQILKAGGVADARIGDLSAFASKPFCLYQTDDVSVLDAARDTFLQGGGYLFADGASIWQVGDYFATKTPIVLRDDQTTTPIVRSIKELPSSTPVWKVRVGFNKCWSVHSESDVSPALSAISDQQLADAAAVEQAIEDAALAVADVATAKARIAAMDSDGILTPSEKLDVVRRLQDIQAEYTGLANQGSQFNIADKKNAYVTAYNNLISYANALTPSLYDMKQDTPVVPAQDESIWDIFYSARADLRVALTGGAATWTNITGPGKPADNADVTGDNTSKDTNAVGGVPAGTIVGVVNNYNADIQALKDATAAAEALGAAASAEAAQVRSDLEPEVMQAQSDAATARTQADTARSELATEVQRAKDDTASIRTVTTQLQTDVSGNTSAITQEITNRATQFQSIADRTTALEATIADPNNNGNAALLSRIATEETTRANADNTISNRTTTLESKVNDPTTGLAATSAKLTEEQTTRADAISALTSRTAVLESSINDPANNDTSAIIARINAVDTTSATRDAALADRASSLESAVNNPSTGLAATSARISVEETTRATQVDSLSTRTGSLESTVNNPYTGIAANTARIAQEETTRADQISSVANRTYTLESRTGNSSNYRSANATFTAWPDGSPLPSQWQYWSNPGLITRDGSQFQSGAYLFGQTLSDANDGGISQTFYVTAGSWVIDASVWCSSGTFQGAGVYADQVGLLNFSTVPDQSQNKGVGGPGIREWSVLFNTAYTGQVNLYAMTNWSSFAPTSPKALHWLKCGIRPASAAEVLAQKADATLNGAGGVVAQIQQEQTTRSDQISSLANQTNSLQANFATLKGNPNLLGSLNDWSGIAGFANSVYWGPVRQYNGVQGDYEQLFAVSPGVALAGNATYTLSCDLLALGDYGPYATMDVICYDANNNITLDSNNTPSINADFSDGRAIGSLAVSFTTPGNTTYGIVRLLGNSRNGNSAIGCRKVKLELGGTATAYNTDQATTANNAAIKNEASVRSDQFSSLSSQTTTLQSQYTGVRTDLNNWNNDRYNDYVAANARISDVQTTLTNSTSALASRTYTLEASSKTGGNLLTSSTFATTAGWGPAISNPSMVSGINLAGDDWHPTNENALSFQQPNNDGGIYAYWYSDLIAVNVGQWYQFSCYVASHRADAGLGCENWSADGQTNYGLATPVRIQRGSGTNGGRDLNGWDLVHFNYQAWQPAMKMNLWKWGTNPGNGDSWAWFVRPQLVQVANGDAPLVPYSPASGSAAINNAIARVSTTEAALSDVRGRSSSYWQVLSVSGDNRAQLTVHSDSNGGAGVDIVGDVRITGQNGNGTSVVSNTGFRVYYPNGQIAVDLGI